MNVRRHRSFEEAITKVMGELTDDGAGAPNLTSQVSVNFADKESAIVFCETNGIDYTLFEPKERKLNIKAYSGNVSYSRVRG